MLGIEKQKYFDFFLTDPLDFDSLKKFAQKCSATSSRAAARLRFPDPSGPLRRFPAWIFDNQVEHASRENREDLGLIILTMLELRSHFERCGADYSTDLRRTWSNHQVSNESLILAQNQRGRRA